jgi:hypothetical protein
MLTSSPGLPGSFFSSKVKIKITISPVPGMYAASSLHLLHYFLHVLTLDTRSGRGFQNILILKWKFNYFYIIQIPNFQDLTSRSLSCHVVSAGSSQLFYMPFPCFYSPVRSTTGTIKREGMYHNPVSGKKKYNPGCNHFGNSIYTK